jgi:hypothetical protein
MQDDGWWWAYMPKPQETYQDYLRRALSFDLAFVTMKHTPENIEIIAQGQALLATRHYHWPRRFVCFAIRDLVFLAYSEEYENEAW